MRISDWRSDVCSSDLAHVGQDVIAGAIEDAVDALDAVGGQPLAQGLDDGTAARHRRLVGEHDTFRFCRLAECGALMGAQGLVGSSDARRVGQECFSPCRSRWWPYHKKKQKIHN